MIYGLVERKRTRWDEKTSWYWHIDRTDDVDRVNDHNHKPNNSLFWYFPNHMKDADVINAMVSKQFEDTHNDIKWLKHNFNESKKAAKRFLKRGMSETDYFRTSSEPTDAEVMEKEKKNFIKWYRKKFKVTPHYREIKVWEYCFKKENFIK